MMETRGGDGTTGSAGADPGRCRHSSVCFKLQSLKGPEVFVSIALRIAGG